MPRTPATPPEKSERDLLRQRLANQRLSRAPFEQPVEAVAALGAVQAQDYAAAKWALGMRLKSATEAMLDQAFNDGAILRTHVLRPTWHFVAPADARWLLALTAPRVKALLVPYDRQTGIDAALRKRSQALMTRALQGGQQLTRSELNQMLKRAGVTVNSLGMIHLVMHAELDGLIISGPRRGKQFSYMLLEERVPPAPALSREQALGELVLRYFTSHGPAQVQDFAWWSGLTAGDAKQGLAAAGSRLARETFAGQEFWLAAENPVDDPAENPAAMPRNAYLLPNYDEYTVAYKDRTHFYDQADFTSPIARDNVPFANMIVLHGRVVGIWKRTLTKTAVTVETKLLHPPLAAGEQRALAAALKRYGEFLGLAVIVK